MIQAPQLDEPLQRHLKTFSCNAGMRDISVVIVRGSDVTTASVNDKSGDFDHSSPVSANCLAKVLTTTLLAREMSNGNLSLDSELNSILRTEVDSQASTLRRIKLRQLTNHTHGLDSSALRTVTLKSTSQICEVSLLNALARERVISDPRQSLYSYSSAGAWLAAMLVEQLTGESFADTLRDFLWAVPGLDRNQDNHFHVPAPEKLCAANGGDLRLSAWAFACLLNLWMTNAIYNSLLAESSSFPGFSPHRRGFTCGWYDYWDSWHGHNGQSYQEGIALRFNHQSHTGIVVTARSPRSAYFALRNLFGKVLPEFREHERQRALHASIPPNMELLNSVVGPYRNAAATMTISRDAAGSYRVDMRSNANASECVSSAIRPYSSSLFEGFQISTPKFPLPNFLQPISDEGMLWDGHILWRRDRLN